MESHLLGYHSFMSMYKWGIYRVQNLLQFRLFCFTDATWCDEPEVTALLFTYSYLSAAECHGTWRQRSRNGYASSMQKSWVMLRCTEGQITCIGHVNWLIYRFSIEVKLVKLVGRAKLLLIITYYVADAERCLVVSRSGESCLIHRCHLSSDFLWLGLCGMISFSR